MTVMAQLAEPLQCFRNGVTERRRDPAGRIAPHDEIAGGRGAVRAVECRDPLAGRVALSELHPACGRIQKVGALSLIGCLAGTSFALSRAPVAIPDLLAEIIEHDAVSPALVYREKRGCSLDPLQSRTQRQSNQGGGFA